MPVKVAKFFHLFMKDFYVRFIFLFFVTSFYLFVTLFYSLDLLELAASDLSKKFSLDLMLTQLEDLSTVLFFLVRILMLTFVVPVFFVQILMFFSPALYAQEKLFLNLFFFRIFLGFFLSFFIFLFIYLFIYLRSSSQVSAFNLGTSTKILVDFKKVFFSSLVLSKYILLGFLPLNYFSVFSLSFRSLNYNLVKSNLFLYLFIYLLGLFYIESSDQFNLLFLVQLSQLELFILIHSITSRFYLKPA